MEIALHTIKNCSHCMQAKAYLGSKGVKYKEIDMSIGGDKSIQELKRLFKAIGLKEYPVLLIKETKQILQGFNQKEYDEIFL